jgi:hypothetical protein
MTRAARIAPLLLAALHAVPAAAHDRTVSYSTWDIDGPRAHVTARVSQLDVSRLPWAATAGPDLDQRLGDYLAQRLTLRADGQPCPVSSGPARLPTTSDSVAFEWQMTCASARAMRIHSAVLTDLAPSHLHYVRVRRAGQPSLDRILSEADPAWTIGGAAAQPTAGDSFADFLRLGVERVASGWDQLALLLGLLLLGGTSRELVRTVIAFIVAASLTLALTVFGVSRPAAAPVEALVGLSVAWIAAENLWLSGGRRPGVRWVLVAALLAVAAGAQRGRGAVPALTLVGLAICAACYLALLARAPRPAAPRAALAFAFGLVHGFALAGVLSAAELPGEHLARALFGFNAGIVLGQIAAVLALWSLLQLARRYRAGFLQRAVVDYASVLILVVGTFWFVSRSYG